MKKRIAWSVVGVVVLVAALFAVANRPHFGGVPDIPNFNAPQPVPTPCILTGIGANPPETLCHDRCFGGEFHAIPKLVDFPTGTYGCCPDGFDMVKPNGVLICKKR